MEPSMSGTSVVIHGGPGRSIRAESGESISGPSMSGTSVMRGFLAATCGSPCELRLGLGQGPKYVPCVVSKRSVGGASRHQPRSPVEPIRGRNPEGPDVLGEMERICRARIGRGMALADPRGEASRWSGWYDSVVRDRQLRTASGPPGRFQDGMSGIGPERVFGGRTESAIRAEEVFPGRPAFGLETVESLDEPGGGFDRVGRDCRGGKVERERLGGLARRPWRMADFVTERGDLPAQGFDPVESGPRKARRRRTGTWRRASRIWACGSPGSREAPARTISEPAGAPEGYAASSMPAGPEVIPRSARRFGPGSGPRVRLGVARPGR